MGSGLQPRGSKSKIHTNMTLSLTGKKQSLPPVKIARFTKNIPDSQNSKELSFGNVLGIKYVFLMLNLPHVSSPN